MIDSTVVVSRLKINHTNETLGIGTPRPLLTWQVETAIPSWRQAGYEVIANAVSSNLVSDTELVETSSTGYLKSGQSVLVAWPFAPLISRQKIAIKVKVWGEDGSESAWSEPAQIEMGLLDESDWRASFITPGLAEDTNIDNPSPYLRHEFDLHDNIASARLYISALGVYEAYLNGAAIGDQILSPGWTVYDQRLRYQTFDITAMLKPGRNAIGAILGDGWYRGRIGFNGGKRNIWGDKLALLAQLEVTYQDGSTATIVSDQNWQAATGAILSNSLYDGETYDSRLEPAGWNQAGFAAAGWLDVKNHEYDLKVMQAPIGPPVRCTETLKPVAIFQSPSGKTLVDFGQNLVGKLSIRVQGDPGQTITLRHAEVLENGELGVRPLRLAKATDHYTLKGSDVETWTPRFTFHGFRYAEVTGWPGELDPADISALVIHSDLERTGWFECSDPQLNRLHENVIWGMRGNFVDVPTDCPQRDERLGWTGDLQVFSPTASYLYDVDGFLRSWLADLAAEQQKLGGVVPPFVPNALGENMGAAAWGDVATVVPWVLYQRFGDADILNVQFESMRTWVDFVATEAGEKHLWDSGFQFGDWLDPTAPPDQPWQARTDKVIVASAYFAYSSRLVAQAAEILGREDDRQYYADLAATAATAFAREYVTPAGRMMCDAETAYSVALAFDLIPTAAQRQNAGKRLAELVRDSGFHIRTGFVGTPLICDALSMTGHFREAYQLLMQQECPSWLYQVTMGATTIWERWDSMLSDGTINPGEMTSFNHYALGAVADWMHRTIGGLSPAEPGYHRLLISPRPGGGITNAQVRYVTPYGPAECTWKIEQGQFTLDVKIPPNTTAQVELPDKNQPVIEVGSGSWRWSVPYQDPDVRGPLSVDDLIGDLMVDTSARHAVLEILDQYDVPGYLKAILFNERNISLRQGLKSLHNADQVLAKLDEALAKLK